MPIVKSAQVREKILDGLLRNHVRKRTIEELARVVGDKLGTTVSKETIYNDIKHIRSEYDAVISKNKESQYYYEDADFSILKTPLNGEDKNMLNLASNIFSVFRSSPIFEKFQHTLNKIITGSTIAKMNNDSVDCIFPAQSHGDKGIEWIDPIYDAIVNENAIEIEYQKLGEEPEAKIISPYVLKETRDHHWYVVGYDHLKDNKTKIYSLDKILNFKISKKKFFKDKTFNAKEMFEFSFGIYHNYHQKPIKMHLRFQQPYVNHIMNYPLSPNQTAVLSEDGRSVEVFVELFDSFEIEREILSYGASVQVLAPKSFANKIKEIAKNVASSYQ
jgi:predicted DNA-binding transcriptional regulator YafY